VYGSQTWFPWQHTWLPAGPQVVPVQPHWQLLFITWPFGQLLTQVAGAPFTEQNVVPAGQVQLQLDRLAVAPAGHRMHVWLLVHSWLPFPH